MGGFARGRPRAPGPQGRLGGARDGGAALSVAPAGLVDLHIHGAFGIDLMTAGPDQLDVLAQKLASRGVAEFLPTLVPTRLDQTAAATARITAWTKGRRQDDGRGAFPLGIHFEGPFVSRARCGALHPEHLLDGRDRRKVAAFFEAIGEPPGRPMTTLAPEIAGGIALVEEFVRRGFLVSIGHTEADVATLDRALLAGARHMTHFGNAMKPLHHREVGPIGWGLLHEEVTVDLIADLHHLSVDMLRLVFRTKGAERVAIISDAVPAAGLPDGSYDVWGETLTLENGAVRNAAGNLAGSACLLDEAVERLVWIGIEETLARRAARDTPRSILSD